MSAAASQMPIRRSASAIRASASTMAASAAAIAGAGTVAAVARLPGGHGVGGSQGRPGRRQVAAGLLEVLLRAVQGQGNLFLEGLHLTGTLADLILGVGQRLEELGVRAVPGAVPPVLLAAGAVTGAGAGVQGLEGGGQADHRPRVDASALRAREHLTYG